MSMTVSGNLKLPQSPRAAVFRRIVDQLRADPEIRARLRSWRVWDGASNDTLPWSAAQCPGVRLTPQGEPMQFQSPDAFLSRLTIGVEVAVASLHLDDAENLVWLIVRALYPGDRAKRLALMQARKEAGAQTGLIEVGGVSYDKPADTNPPVLVVSFGLSIAVSLLVNP